jgi:hypothetical protein
MCPWFERAIMPRRTSATPAARALDVALHTDGKLDRGVEALYVIFFTPDRSPVLATDMTGFVSTGTGLASLLGAVAATAAWAAPVTVVDGRLPDRG